MLPNQEQSDKNKPRAKLYVDGFNLYHPLCELNKPHLKWLNLWHLGDLICSDRGHNLTGVTYCSAFREHSLEQKNRHKIYISALSHVGVESVMGHYMKHDTDPCSNCGVIEERAEEKQTDINLALSVFADAMQDKFDWAYLLSADSDQAATAKFLKNYFPDKKLITVVPPNKKISKYIQSLSDGKRMLNESDIKKSRFESIVLDAKGGPIRCPREYDLPTA